jgi:hypothetical protein
MGLGRWLAHFRRRPEEDLPAAALARSRELVEDAVRNGRQMVAFRGKEWLVFSPRTIRDGTDGPRVLAYLVCGRPYLDPQADDPSQRWVWLPLAELWGLDARGDPEEREPAPVRRLQPAG